MDSRRNSVAPDFEWSDTVPGPDLRNRIVRTPMPVVETASVERISVVFKQLLPQPTVLELDATTGWAEFESALRRQETR